MKRLVLILAIFASAAAAAQVYKRVGPDGKVYFSDQPGTDADRVEVQPAQTISLPPVTEESDVVTEQPGPVYTAFAIVSPAGEQEIRANNGNVTVQLSLQPELQPGHSIKLMIDGEDGEAIKQGDGMSVTLNNLSRGRHTVAARVVDTAGKPLMQADPVGFNVLRAAVGR